MKRTKSGFTLIELVVVILIGGILTSIAFTGVQSARSQFAAQSAKRVYMSWHQRARSMAIERGETVVMVVYVDGDSTALLRREGGTFVWSDIQKFDEELGVDLRTQGNVSFYTCMSPRGYADLSCGSLGPLLGLSATFSDTVRLQFWQGADSASVLILPLGQTVG
jgi:prepilin-type N-terminal cleavage/methylation domain-containing protein